MHRSGTRNFTISEIALLPWLSLLSSRRLEAGTQNFVISEVPALQILEFLSWHEKRPDRANFAVFRIRIGHALYFERSSLVH